MNQFNSVLVLYDLEYSVDDERLTIKQGEKLVLISKSSDDWWLVRRPVPYDHTQMTEHRLEPFFVPSAYIQSIDDQNSNNDLKVPLQAPSNEGQCDQTTTPKSSSPIDSSEIDDSLGVHSFDSSPIGSDNDGCLSKSESLEGIYVEPFFVRARPRKDRCDHDYANLNSIDEQNKLDVLNSNHKCKSNPPSINHSGVRHKRTLFDGWSEYVDSDNRRFYYNSTTLKSSWKPPRRMTVKGDNRNRGNDVSCERKHSLDSQTHLHELMNGNKVNKDNGDQRANSKHNVKHKPQRLDSFDSVPCLPSKIGNDKLTREQSTQTDADLPLMSHCTITENDMLSANEVFINWHGREKWFCKRSENGRVIIYDENSQNMFNDMSHVGNEQSRQYKINDHYDQDVDTRSKQNMKSNFKYGPNLGNDLQLVNHDRNVKAHSMALLSNRNNNSQDLIVFNEQFKHSSPLQSFQYFPPPPTSLNMKDIINSGTLSRARTQVSGKMSKRKNWCTSYLVLTKYYLIFFKDQKSAFASKVLKPEFVLGLLQASIEWCPTKSRRKNCFQVSTFQDQVLLHEENGELNSKWFSAIRDCISKLPTPFNSNSKLSMLNDGSSMATQTKLKRSRSTKQYRPNEELELPGGGRNTLSGYATIANPPMNDKKVKIRERLRQFLRMRPTMESLREKGIIKDENVFGCSLDQLCARDKSSIPKFIQQCVEAIEFRDLKADGIYRACGNLSTVQKLRFEINQDNYHGLWKEEDVHVLTGLLKMFFRSMPEPLFPCDRFSLMMKAISIKDSQAKIDAFRKLINDLPPNNYDTLKFILQHLLRIVEYSQENRMSIPNLAIVFGPTLIWPSSDLNNLVLDMMLQMQQSQAIEFLLLEFNTIFD